MDFLKISKAIELLRDGEVVAIPTETVYGLAGNALNEKAVAKIFSIKNRPSFDPLIVHTDSIEKVKSFVTEFPPFAQKLAERFWAGALTLLLPKKSIIPDLVTSALPNVAVRIPNHPLTLELLSKIDFPLAAPSANPFGYISPTNASHVQKSLGDKIPLILDGGDCQIGIESTIVGFPEGKPTIFRKGGISVEAIEEVIGKVTVVEHSSSRPEAPGMLQRHYAPKAKMILGNIDEMLAKYNSPHTVVLSFQKKHKKISENQQFILSEKGDFTEAAQNLFRVLRMIDEKNPKIILAELLPEMGLGRAINDRLKRGAVIEAFSD
ncbi:MAG: L-threonylcarbamoyladenylate synthase [Flammeovirgaceae bacterium]